MLYRADISAINLVAIILALGAPLVSSVVRGIASYFRRDIELKIKVGSNVVSVRLAKGASAEEVNTIVSEGLRRAEREHHTRDSETPSP